LKEALEDEMTSQFIKRQNRYCENCYVIKSDLQNYFNLDQNPNDLFHRNKKASTKFIWKHKRPQICKETLSIVRNSGGITIPDFKLYYREAIVTEKTWCKAKTDMQTNGI
jgi:hypothetical protein